MVIKIHPTLKLKIGISPCMLGEKVRYDGGHKYQEFLIDSIGDQVEWLPICPEVELGMGIPREPVSLFGEPNEPQMRGNQSNIDHTADMQAWAGQRLAQEDILRLDGFILQSNSPSCGLHNVPVFPTRRTDHPQMGRGLFAQALLEKFPQLPIEDGQALRTPKALERFLARVIAYTSQKA